MMQQSSVELTPSKCGAARDDMHSAEPLAMQCFTSIPSDALVAPPRAAESTAGEAVAIAASPSAPATPSSAAGFKRLNLSSGSARRVLVASNSTAVALDAPSRTSLSGNRSIGAHVLHRRLQPQSTPVITARDRTDSLPSGAQPTSALKSGAKRVVAPAPVHPSPIRAPVFSAVPRGKEGAPAGPAASPARSATPQPPQPHRTPSRVSLALEELSAAGYTPSRLSMRALDDGNCSEAAGLQARPPQPRLQAAQQEEEQLSTPPGMATPLLSSPPDVPAAIEAAPHAQAGGNSGASVGRKARRVAVPFAVPPGSAADIAVADAIGRALLKQAEGAHLSARKPKRGAHELEALCEGAGPSCEPRACAVQYAIAKVPRSAHKEALGTDKAVTPVRRSGRLAAHTPNNSAVADQALGGQPVPLSELLEQAHYAYVPNKALILPQGKPHHDFKQ